MMRAKNFMKFYDTIVNDKACETLLLSKCSQLIILN